MLRIQFQARRHQSLFFRQTPENNGCWHGMEFICSDKPIRADWLVVYNEPPAQIKTSVPRQRRIVFIGDAQGQKNYRLGYLKQFGTVVSTYLPRGYEGRWLQRHPSLPWLFGANPGAVNWLESALKWDEIADRAYEAKPFQLSVICSANASSGQQRRLEFVEFLAARLGERLHWFGKGAKPMTSRADALTPYKYHVVLEDHIQDHFWTEKLADAYLGECFPLYAGCSNLDDYFHPDSFEMLDLSDFGAAADRVEAAVSQNLWEQRRTFIREAKEKILFQYNLFDEARSVIKRLEPYVWNKPTTEKVYTVYPLRSGLRAVLHQWRRNLKKTLNAGGRPVQV